MRPKLLSLTLLLLLTLSFAESVRELEVLWKYRTSGKGKPLTKVIQGPDGTLYGTYGTYEPQIVAFSSQGKYLWDKPHANWAAAPFVSTKGTLYFQKDTATYCAVSPDGTGLWTSSFKMHRDCIPAILDDGTIFAGNDDNILCRISNNGKIVQNLTIKLAKETSPQVSPKGNIYISTTTNTIVTVNPKGVKIEDITLPAKPISSPVISNDGAIYVACNDSSFYALSPKGNIKWKKTSKVVWRNDTYGIYLNSKGALYLYTSEDSLHALTPKGKVLWSQKVDIYSGTNITFDKRGQIYFVSDRTLHSIDVEDGKQGMPREMGAKSIDETPIIGADGTIYLTQWGHLYAYTASGQKRWDTGFGSYINMETKVSKSGKVLFTANDNTFYALKRNGKLDWKVRLPGDASWDPRIDSKDNIYLSTDQDKLVVISSTGTIKTLHTDKRPIRRPAIASDGTVYITTATDSMIAFNSDGSKKWIHSIEGGQNLFYTHPSVGADGTIYYGVFNIHALDSTGKEKWLVKRDSVAILPFVTKMADNSSLVTGKNGYLYAVTEDEERSRIPHRLLIIKPSGKLWQTISTFGHSPHEPVIDTDGTVYIVHNRTQIKALTWDGKEKWDKSIGDGAHYISIGPNGLIYSGNTDGKLYIISKEGTLLAQFDAGKMVASAPAFSQDSSTCYVGCWDHNLYAIKIPEDLQ